MNKPVDKKPKEPKNAANMEMLQQHVEELTAAVQRERADAINMRRRHEEQIAGLKNTVKANVIRQLLPVIDNFERSLQHVPAELASSDYMKGVEAIIKQFSKTLTDLGVRRIATVGQPFDPKYHEAVRMIEGDGMQEVVSQELQSGYLLGDGEAEEVIRHAMVEVKMG